MTYPVSACCFIRNTFAGAYCIFESLASLLPLVSEAIVMDLGSDDGTLEALREIANHNPKVRLVSGSFTYTDAGVFATLANDLVAMCQNDVVWYWQSDEVWHQNLLRLTKEQLDRGEADLGFWRIQFRENWQKIKWFPHLVHRIGAKGKFNFTGDGMNTDRTWDAKICSSYGGEYFPQWGGMNPMDIPTNEMVTDVSLVGGFLENIPDRRAMHAPFWHETIDIEGLPPDRWMERERANENWYKTESPFDIPAILKHHLGKVRYSLRPELLEALKRDRTANYIEELV